MLPLTPRLVLDESRLTRNLSAMQRRIDSLGARFRPHAKTHKSAEIMRRQLALGAHGATVATIREAEVMIDAGASDVLLAFPPVGEPRIAAIGRLARRARLTVCCSTEKHVIALERHGAIPYYWEIEVGAARLGTPPGEATALRLEALAPNAPRLVGLMAFAGHSYAALTTTDRLAVLASERDALAITAAALRARGLEPGVLSVGSTPLAGLAHAGVDEYRFGNYVFCDATQVALGTATVDDCAVWVEASVLDLPAPGRMILDAGSKALAAERMSGATTGFGLVRDRPDIEVAQLYEEHAICRLTGDAPAPAIGDVLEIVPNHACTCVNLHAAYAVRESDGGESRWPIDARGWDAEAYHDESEAHG